MSQLISLTHRDYDVLDALGDYRFLAPRHLAALHFPSEDAAVRRMRELCKAHLAHRVTMPVRPYSTTPVSIFALSRVGATYAATRHGGELPRFLTEREQRTGHFLEHTLARNDVRVVMERLSQMHPKFTLLSWRQTPDQVRGSAIVEKRRGFAERVRFVPDGVAIVRVGHECHALAIEIDRGTVKTKNMALRYQAYWRYWRDGGARRDYGPVPFRVLTLTTTPRHQAQLEKVARRAPDGRIGTKVFWFALQEDVADLRQPEKLLRPSWSVAAHAPMTNQPLFFQKLLN